MGTTGVAAIFSNWVVIAEYRRRGIAGKLVESCLSSLENIGIRKCHLDAFEANEAAANYWARQGWQLRRIIDRYSSTRPSDENA